MRLFLTCFMVGFAVHYALFAVKTGEFWDRAMAGLGAAGATFTLVAYLRF